MIRRLGAAGSLLILASFVGSCDSSRAVDALQAPIIGEWTLVNQPFQETVRFESVGRAIRDQRFTVTRSGVQRASGYFSYSGGEIQQGGPVRYVEYGRQTFEGYWPDRDIVDQLVGDELVLRDQGCGYCDNVGAGCTACVRTVRVYRRVGGS